MRRILDHGGRVAIVSIAESDSIPTSAYLAVRRLFPTLLDCRPLPVTSLLDAHGFAVLDTREHSLYGLPVTVAIAKL
jgi:hypothetical protein